MSKLSLPVALLALAACAPTPVVAIEDATFAASLGVDLSQSTKIAGGMYIRELEVGAGDEVLSTSTPKPKVTMRYTGWLTDGTQFDSNQGRGFQFTLGAGEVIQGWDIGVPGMRVGGQRQLIIPSAMGYGPSGVGPIPPNAILVFNVALVSTP